MKFLTLEQFTEMWKLQDELNSKTSGPDWKEKNQNWNLAIKSEVMELFDYIGWKWWKTPDQTKKPSDMQARLELVDIWHFLLSSIIEVSWISIDFEWDRIRSLIEGASPNSSENGKLQVSNLDSTRISNVGKVLLLTDGIQLCEWSWDELYKAYIGKIALNAFRQANGYKEGTYQKIWKTVVVDTTCGGDSFESFEDNFFLEQILTELSLTPGGLTYQAVYHKLSIEYMLRYNN